MKRPRSALLLLLAAGLLLYAACRKTDSPAERPPADLTSQFFVFKSGTDPATLRVLREIQLRNSETGFVNEFARSNGLPVWDKAIVHEPSKPLPFQNVTGSLDTVLYIPLVLPGAGNTNGFIRAILNDTINISHWMAADYDEFPFSAPAGETKADEFASMLMLMDRIVFGTTTFKLLDGRLLKEPGAAVSNYQRLAKIIDIDTMPVPGICTTNVEVVHYLVQDPEHCTCPNGAASGGICADWQTGCDACSNTITVTVYTVNEGGCGGLGVTPVPTNPMGGSGGGTWNPGPIGGGGSGGIGWVPFEDPVGGTPPGPIDTILSKYSRKFRRYGDSVYINLSQPGNREYFFAGAKNNLTGDTVMLNLRTDNPPDSLRVTPNISAAGHYLLFIWHSHVSRSLNLADRRSFSPADIDYLRKPACLKSNFTSFADCHNKQYALVITDVVKAQAFFAANDLTTIEYNYWTTGSGNMQELDERCVKAVIGSAAANGISFYVSTNSPNFSAWTLLNP